MNVEDAKLFFDVGNFAKTENICRAVLEKDPESAPALHLLGCVAFNAGQIAPGTDLIQKAIRLAPQNSRYLFDLGDLLLKSGRFSDAEKIFNDVTDADPEHAVAHVLKGNALSENGRRGDAVECWFRYVSINWGKAENANEKNHPLNSSDFDCPDYQGRIRPYIICTTPRCGSTLLCDLLAQSGSLGIPHEYLNISSHGLNLMSRLGIDLTDPNLARTYLNTLKRVRTTPNGVFGLKAHFHHLKTLLDPPLLNEVFPKAKFARMFRRNRIAQAVSFGIAHQTQQWDSTKEKQNEPVYDADLVDQCLSQILSQESEWTYFFQVNDIKAQKIYYEDLLGDSKSVCREFLNLFGIKTNFDFNIEASKFRRQSNHLNVEWEDHYKSDRGILSG
jgi:LPS sulfotransferase NodH